MKRGIAISMLAILIIALITVISVVLAYSLHTSKGFSGFGNLFSAGNSSAEIARNVTQTNEIVCQQLLESKNCEEFYRRGCDKIIKEKCEGG